VVELWGKGVGGEVYELCEGAVTSQTRTSNSSPISVKSPVNVKSMKPQMYCSITTEDQSSRDNRYLCSRETK
jgi:hypothetical protein